MNATVLQFPIPSPRLVTVAPPPRAAALKVKRYTVRTRWVKLAVPMQPAAHAAIAGRSPRIQRELGEGIAASAAWLHHELASAGSPDPAFVRLLRRAAHEIAPAPGTAPAVLTLDMPADHWSRIADLAGAYGATPLSLVLAFLLQRLDELRQFDRKQAAARP